MAPLTDRQIGRARFDLQRRLEQAGRAIRPALQEHLAEATAVFSSLLTMASSGRRDAGQGGRDEPTALSMQAAQLHHLLGRLGQPAPGLAEG